MRKKILFAIYSIVVITTNAQNYEWAKSFGSTNSDRGYSIYVDTSGNLYTTGYFEATADFDPGSQVLNLTSNGSRDVFVQKMDTSGNFLWAKSFGGTNPETGYGITVDAAGNVYTTGEFWGTVDFDPGTGVANLTSVGNYDIFVHKMDASGNFLWAKSIGGTSADRGESISIDALGNVYVVGHFQSVADFDPGAGVFNITTAGGRDVFVLKLDASGNFLWAKSFGGISVDLGTSINIDLSGNVYTTGYFQGTGDYDPGSGTTNLTSAGSTDIFVQKMDASGNFIWAKSFSGTSPDIGYAISTDDLGNVYVTGDFQGTVDFDPGIGTFNLTAISSYDVFVQKMDASGNFLWAKSFGGSGIDRGYSLKVDALGNVYTTGIFNATVDFDPGVEVANLTTGGSTDIFIQKLNTSGNFVWAKSFGGTGADFSTSIYLDASDNIYITGYFEVTVDFDPGAEIANLTSFGNRDVFVQKLSQETLSTDEAVTDKNVKMYPNPTSEKLILKCNDHNNIKHIEILDVSGRTIKSIQSNFGHEISIDVSHLSSGNYFLKVQSENCTEIKKFIKL